MNTDLEEACLEAGESDSDLQIQLLHVSPSGQLAGHSEAGHQNSTLLAEEGDTWRASTARDSFWLGSPSLFCTRRKAYATIIAHSWSLKRQTRA